MPEDVRFRQYDPHDDDAIQALDEWAMRAEGVDPSDVPGIDDLRRVDEVYLDGGGEFLVGVGRSGLDLSTDGDTDDGELPRTFDGPVVATGGFLPSEAGHEDERTVPGAAELHRMRVAPPYQGQGYGRGLLDALEARAVELEFDPMLATTAARQTAATQFYPAAGYEEVDRSVAGEYELRHFEKPL